MTDVADAPMHAAESTVRVLLNIMVNGVQDEWVTRDTAQAWINELKVVLARLEDAGRIEGERDEFSVRLTECRSEIEDLWARIASHESGCEHEAWESKHAVELALVKAERDIAAFDAEVALTERIVARLVRIAKGVGGVNPAMRDGLLLAAGEANVERLYEPDEARATYGSSAAELKETIPDLNSGAPD